MEAIVCVQHRWLGQNDLCYNLQLLLLFSLLESVASREGYFHSSVLGWRREGKLYILFYFFEPGHSPRSYWFLFFFVLTWICCSISMIFTMKCLHWLLYWALTASFLICFVDLQKLWLRFLLNTISEMRFNSSSINGLHFFSLLNPFQTYRGS